MVASAGSTCTFICFFLTSPPDWLLHWSRERGRDGREKSQKWPGALAASLLPVLAPKLAAVHAGEAGCGELSLEVLGELPVRPFRVGRHIDSLCVSQGSGSRGRVGSPDLRPSFQGLDYIHLLSLGPSPPLPCTLNTLS